ncbi:pepsin-like aspartic protease [Pleionea litopenaei]|uniref:Pepsin-like aspartic protease n=1 Tax=Pleionea litopenaei TaxID=3070815 RepID=A0AA51RWD4_9GAMM|nr:pepsin-like aspartic protease [Pleionea sp. HL-JVS1]WMS88876.1 pepsin-like aspartic protease [Pleionea sp. HL-JVS1]
MNDNKALRIPITNVYANGDYTMDVYLGSEHQKARVILDTGSSTLAVHPTNYRPESDHYLQPTSYAQDVTYGLGGWTGPLIKTSLTLAGHCSQRDAEHAFTVATTHVAVATTEQPHAFANADGIMGLAYHGLNKAFNLHDYFEQNQVVPAVTFPWPFSVKATHQAIVDFKKFLWHYVEQDILPCFTEWEAHGYCANQFSFLTHRSSIHHAQADLTLEELEQDPLNQGIFVLGGGEEQDHLYQGEFTDIPVLHHVYYNVDLAAIQVANLEQRAAPALAEKDQAHYFSNAILDTGASAIVLPATLYQTLLDDIRTIAPSSYHCLINYPAFNGEEQGINIQEMENLAWPDIKFWFRGVKAPLVVTAREYWQMNAPKFGLASFKIFSQLAHWPDQSILGLPIFNPYFTIFDRQNNATIRFAEKRSSTT